MYTRMEDSITEIQSSNINSLWLTNIFENLKKVENFERIAREGCETIVEYLQNRSMLADIQYKNLKLMANELKLVVPDLAPVIGEDLTNEVDQEIKDILKHIHNRKMFVREPYSEVRNVRIASGVLPYFYETLEKLARLRRKIILIIKKILFIDSPVKKTW